MDKIKMDMKEKREYYDKYHNNLTWSNKFFRLWWNVCYLLLFRPFCGSIFIFWRLFILRCFGARIDEGSIVYASASIWAPWNLRIGKRSCIGPHTIIYNPGKIVIGNKVAISQRSHLCAASHDYESILNELVCKTIRVEDRAWIAADAFVGMGVTIGEGAVVGARACVFTDVEPWTVVGGNPAREIKKRVMRKENDYA